MPLQMQRYRLTALLPLDGQPPRRCWLTEFLPLDVQLPRRCRLTALLPNSLEGQPSRNSTHEHLCIKALSQN